MDPLKEKFKAKAAILSSEIKDIVKVVDVKPIFDPERLELISWLSRYYIQPLGSVIKFFLPPGGKYKKAIAGPGIKLKFEREE